MAQCLFQIYSLGFLPYKYLQNQADFREKCLFVQKKDEVFSDVPVRLYIPRHKPENSAVVVYIHGGGFASGTLGR